MTPPPSHPRSIDDFPRRPGTRPLRAVVARALFPLTLTACAPAQGPPDLEQARTRLAEADQRYIEAANAGDVEGLAALYADDATRYPPDGTPSSGREAMLAFARGVAATEGFRLTSRARAMEVSPDGKMAYTLNELDLSFAGPDGRAATQRLRDLHTWRLEGGDWRIVVDIWQVLPNGEGDGT